MESTSASQSDWDRDAAAEHVAWVRAGAQPRDHGWEWDRRKTSRWSACVFTGEERQRYREGMAGVATCADGYASMRRTQGGVTYRILAPMGCGRRSCGVCGPAGRLRMGARLAGYEWRRMITLTLPREGSVCDAWRGISGAVRKFLRWMRGDMGENPGDYLQGRAAPWAPGLGEVATEYAWALEEQPGSGWPHLHLLSGARSVWGAQWEALARRTKRAWQRAVGAKEAPVVHWKEIEGHRAAANYVTKYVTKVALAPMWYAILGKRRVFGSSLRVKRKELIGWKCDGVVSGREGRLQLEIPAVYRPGTEWAYGWREEIGSSCWFRPATEAEMECGRLGVGLPGWKEFLEDARREVRRGGTGV